MLGELRHGNTDYIGVGTEKGVLLFSRDYRGRPQYYDFMETNIEKRFFRPDFEGKSLTVYELRGWPSLMKGRINRCYGGYGNILPVEEIPADAYVDRSLLKSVTDEQTYDLAPSWENYFRLTDTGHGLGLPRSPENYDRMVLLNIMDEGIPMGGLTDDPPDRFSLYGKFEKIEDKLCGRDRWDVYDEMQEKAKRLAKRLLERHFPGTRMKADAAPKVKAQKDIPKKGKGRRM